MNFGLTGECQTRQITHRQPPHGTKGGESPVTAVAESLDPLRESLMHIQTYRQWGREGQGLFPSPLPPIPPPLSGNRIPPRYRTISAQDMLPASLRATHTHTHKHRHKHRYTQTHTATVTRLSSPDRHRIHYKYPQRSTRTITHFWLPPLPTQIHMHTLAQLSLVRLQPSAKANIPVVEPCCTDSTTMIS